MVSTAQAESPTYFLPRTLTRWPWKRHINPLYHQVKSESSTWIRGFNAFSPRAQRAFDLCDFNLLASLAYPREQKDVVRAGCDLMNLFFLFDEYTDVADPREAEHLAAIVMDAMRNPYKSRPSDECVVGEAARQFWKRSMQCASNSARHRFVESFATYTASVVQQANDRAQKYIRSIEDYFLVRRDTIGAKPSFVLLHFGLNLPEEVFEDPVIIRLTNSCIDMLILGNDICSYNVEQARDDDSHNIVKIIMHQQKTGLQGTMKWIEDYHSKLVNGFLDDVTRLPSFGVTLDGAVRRYVDGLGNWVRANDCWSFESHRYFGTEGPEIQRTRKVNLLPRAINVEKGEQKAKPANDAVIKGRGDCQDRNSPDSRSDAAAFQPVSVYRLTKGALEKFGVFFIFILFPVFLVLWFD